MKLADVSIKRPVLASVMMAVLVVFGLFAYPRVGIDLFPDVEFPFVTVTAVYPGADPETVESRIVEKLEEAISTVNGIKMLRSTSMENVGMVVVQFELERKAEQALQDVRDKVAIAVKDLPSDLETPIVQRFDTGAAPIIALAVAGQLTPRELMKLADDVIKQRLQTINGVGGVDIVGGQDREFHVWIDPNRLESYGLSAMDVMQALAAQNVEIPGGRLDLGPRELSVRTKGQVHTAQELRQIIIPAAVGAPVRIGDVARVEDGVEEQRSYAAFNGTSAVGLVVRKQSGSNTVEVAKAVRAAVAELTPRMPKGINISMPTDNSTFIQNSINDVQFDLLYGGLLAVLIIMFFLHDWRATFISALALPVSVVATFAFIQAMGYTFNMMTMLALSLSIGILIDDAIVVIENIHRHLEQGKPPMRAAAEATNEIGLAVIATTASILAVFVPVATMKGMIGRFFVQFGLTVAFAVTVSLFVAFTLTPMASARLLRLHHGEKRGVGRAIESMLGVVDGMYRKILGWALRHRAATVLLAMTAFVASIGIARYIPTEFMTQEDRGQFNVKFELPTGTAFDVTKKYADEMAADIRKMPGVTATFVTIGDSSQAEVNQATIQVNLVAKHARKFSQDNMIQFVRDRFGSRKDLVLAVEPINMFGSSSGFRSAIVQFNIRGNDYEQLSKSAADLIAELRKRGGYADLDTSYRGGKPEVAIDIDRDRAADLGVPVASLATTVRTLIAGEKASEITADGDRYDVRVKLDESYRQHPTDLLTLKVRSTSGQLIALSNVVAISPGAGPSKIDRQNRQRQVTVLANLNSGKTLGQAITEVNALAKDKLPASLVSDWTGQGDFMKESFMNLLTALGLAVVIVYLLLAAQFESWVHPLTIMMSLPLSLVGALGALALTHQPLGIMSMIGVIMLMGLVTKNAILLVDYTNHMRRQGMSKDEALLAAGPVRLRPILMTTAAMIFGMIPVATGLSEGGEMRAPMAITVIGGLVTSTFLTLVVIPVAYSLLDGLSRKAAFTQTEEAAVAAH